MKMTIDVRNRDEGDAIRLAMEDPETRAYVLITGLLMQLPDMETRMRVLHCAEVLLSTRPAPVLTPTGRQQLGLGSDGNGGMRLHDAGSSE